MTGWLVQISKVISLITCWALQYFCFENSANLNKSRFWISPKGITNVNRIYDGTTKKKQSIFSSELDVCSPVFSEFLILNLSDFTLHAVISTLAHFVEQTFTAWTPWMSFCQNLTQNLIQAPSLHQKWIEENGIISWVCSFCCKSFYLIPFPFNKTLFLPCQNILPSLSHFLSSSSVSLWISLLIISGRKPLMFPCPCISLICRSFLLNAIFLLLLWTLSSLDSLIAAMPVYVTDQKWWEEKNAKKKEAKYLEVLFGKDSKPPIWSVITSLLSLTCFITIYI